MEFLDELKVVFQCLSPRIRIKGDFLVNEKFTFEIGGKNKSFKQIKDISNSFVVADDIEIGSGNKIPLWLFVLRFGLCVGLCRAKRLMFFYFITFIYNLS